jgi:hypothetical protein
MDAALPRGLRTCIDPVEDLAAAKVLWGVDDIHAAHARSIALGASELSAVQDVGSGILVSALRCPFANRLGLIFNPHFDVATVR